MEAMGKNGQICHQEFQIYPPMLRRFAHVLRDKYGLTGSQQVDIYEKVGMFLCILAHGKGYQQVTTLFNHSLQTVCVFFKEVLRAVVMLSEHVIRPAWNYNDGVDPHTPHSNKHPLFQDCIGAIDRTHVRTVLPRHECVNFMGRKGVPTQNVLAACDFNLCFMFVLAGYTGNTHDARMLARAIYSPEIDFSQSAPRKYYLVDSDFAHQPGYMAPYKGSDILYHFQQFRNERTGQRLVLAMMDVHNFLRRYGIVDEVFARAKTNEDVAEVELPSAEDEVEADMNSPEMQRSEWNRLRDYMAQQP
ncbi:uncharacterized protein LOC111369125 [Olea europaea var. sylvestris]|uniref:uncharacterized protein LOC111369125 n=1 Tax=Olea europaea var. sylvestris TaxID=158386 RepID=UPI000C1D232F|nr:uncharacterized protein LOC111369125 [Olea europaea var. sylvestris]